MEALRGIVEFWPLPAFVGAMVWWAASMSKDVHIMQKDVQALKNDVREIKQLILKQAGA
jgi:hypothetical protein